MTEEVLTKMTLALLHDDLATLKSLVPKIEINTLYQTFGIVCNTYDDFNSCNCDMDYGCHSFTCSVEKGQYYVFPRVDENSRYLYIFEYFRDDKKTFGSKFPWSALHLASAMGSEKCIDFLLKNGAELNLKDATGRSASEIGLLLKEVKKNF
jgi:hypothetical protein